MGEEEDAGEDLVGLGAGEVLDGEDAAVDRRMGRDERGEQGRGGGLLGVALGEVVNPRIGGGDLDRIPGAGPPDCGVHLPELSRHC